MTEPSGFWAASAQAYTERGVDGLAESWDPELVYEEDPLWPGSGTFEGRTAVMARFREYEEQLGFGAAKIERVVEGRNAAVVLWRHTGMSAGAGIPFEQRWAWLVRIRDGKAVYIRAYLDPDHARRAAETAD
jgi:ketosteroid isomerase-like protein